MNSRVRTSSLFLLVAVLVCGGCNGNGNGGGLAAQAIPQQQQALRGQLQPTLVKGNTPVQHIIVMIQENRTFDDFFATFPGVDGTTTGKMDNGKTIQLKKEHLAALDMNHMRPQYLIDCDLKGSVCQMDGFNHTYFGQFPAKPTYPYQYANPDEIKPYWFIAQNYAIGDHMFQTQGSGSFTAHQDFIAGWTKINSSHSIVNVPSDNQHWGCDSHKGTVTDLLTTKLKLESGQGPFPCLTYPTGTLRDLLDAKGVSWRYYSPPHKGGGTSGNIWNAYDAIDAVRNGPEWQTNISVPETNIFNDLSNGTLAQMNWIVPSDVDSDHPHKLNGTYHGPEWIASVVNAVGQSQYWNNTTVLVLWDDWGGFYDHVPPAFIDNQGGLGFRVPFLIVSPYVNKGQVVSTQYEFASVVKYVEETFKLGSLHSNDERAHSLTTLFHFKAKPRAFVAVPSSLDKNYFLRQPPDYEPVDTQ
jgi:phospholipase C